jgi:hypothetical protein
MRSLQYIDAMVSKATGLYARHCKRNGYLFQQPGSGPSDIEEVGDKQYVVLRNGPGMLAVYHFNPGTERMRFVPEEKWPKEVVA